MATDPNDWIPEEEAAAQLGVNRDDLRAQRPVLGPGEVKREGNVVKWLRGAVARVATAMGLAFEKNAPPAPPVEQGVEELTVASQPMQPGGRHFPNQFLIKARRPNGEVVVVRVLDSSKYLPRLRTGGPMTFKAKKSGGHWWVPVGREPRFPGAW